MSDQPCLLLRRKDGKPIDLDTWRRIAAECGVEITDDYEQINPFGGRPWYSRIPGSGRWRRENGTLHLRFQGQDVHIRHPCDINDEGLNQLATLLEAELAPEDPFELLQEQLRRDREEATDS